MAESGHSAAEIVAREGLQQVSDPGALDAAVEVVLAQHAEVVASYLSGKDKSFTFLVGMAMKETAGRANPALVRDALMRALEGLKAKNS